MLRCRSSESRDSTVTMQHTVRHVVGAHSIVFGVNKHEYIVSHFIKKKKKDGYMKLPGCTEGGSSQQWGLWAGAWQRCSVLSVKAQKINFC